MRYSKNSTVRLKKDPENQTGQISKVFERHGEYLVIWDDGTTSIETDETIIL